MKQIAQNYKSGSLELVEVPTPALQAGMIQVRTRFSVVSPGTEGTKISEARMNLLQKARARPDHVKQVLKTMRQQGVRSTYQKVMNKLDSLSPLGYCASGIIEAVGEGCDQFKVGQHVAIAGAGYANHAQVNVVPKQLCAQVPQSVSLEHAAFTTMGMIALHGFRQGDMRLGETAVVIGLGMVGQLLGQMALAAGMHVVGIDLDLERCEMAKACGFHAAGAPNDSAVAHYVQRISQQAGADCVFLCLGTASNQPLLDAINLCRDRGRVVCVGHAKMDLPYPLAFKKEIEFRFSRSYGPGRYDPNYEEKGQDYPIGYVRWSEGRNMQAVLQLMAQQKLQIDALISKQVPFEQAPSIYKQMHAGELKGIGILFDYQIEKQSKPLLSIASQVAEKQKDQLGVGCIGVGNYAASMLLPHLQHHKEVSLREVANATSLSSKNVADRFGFARASTSADAVLNAADIDAVLIATRHQLHASLTAQALQQGKAVFVEKPLAIYKAELQALQQQLEEMENPRLHVGFNRRFSPAIARIKQALPEGAPLAMHYRVHAGAIDPKHWVLDSAEGGRFVGEVGHFLDVFAYLTGASPISVSAQRQQPSVPSAQDADNWALLIHYSDGSVATLQYLCQGGAKLPKEFLEVSGGNITAVLDNFVSVTIYNDARPAKIHKGHGGDKGQKQQIKAVLESWRNPAAPMPISAACLLETSWLTLACVESAALQQPVLVNDYAR